MKDRDRIDLRSSIGLGMAALGRPGYVNLSHAVDLEGNYDGAAMEQRAYQVLDSAWAGGVRYFDTARSYGRGEEFLGGWLSLRGIEAQAVSVGSKWGYVYTAGWQVQAEAHEVKEHSLALLRRQWAESHAHLGGYLRIYQIHSATPESGVLENREVLAELGRLRAAGLAIGLSTSGPQQAATIRQALTLRVAGVPLFAAVQSTWNVLEPSAGAALAEAHAAGLAVIVKEALANGRLTERNAEPSFARQLALLRSEAARLGTSLDALSLAAALAQPWATTVLSGAATVAHMQSNLSASTVAWDAEAAASLCSLSESAESYWATRRALAWN